MMTLPCRLGKSVAGLKRVENNEPIEQSNHVLVEGIYKCKVSHLCMSLGAVWEASLAWSAVTKRISVIIH